MKGGKRPLGYTIIEVMIVLAVSGVMFLIAATFINGKQARTEFSAGTNDLASQLQGIIEDVTDGHYSGEALTCDGTASPVSIAGGGTGQGTNSTCVFLGKLVHFSERSQPNQFEIFSLAGALNITNPGCFPPGSITSPQPASNPLCDAVSPICLSGSCTSTSNPDLTTQAIIPQNLDIYGTQIIDTAGTTFRNSYYGIGFVQGFGAVTGAAYQTGSPTIELIYAPGVTSALDESHAATVISNSGLLAARQADICISDSRTGAAGSRKADISIGDKTTNATQLSVDVHMGATAACP